MNERRVESCNIVSFQWALREALQSWGFHDDNQNRITDTKSTERGGVGKGATEHNGSNGVDLLSFIHTRPSVDAQMMGYTPDRLLQWPLACIPNMTKTK